MVKSLRPTMPQDAKFRFSTPRKFTLARLSDTITGRFVIVGVSVAFLFFVLHYLLMRIGVLPFASSIISYAVAFVFAYIAQQRWTFGGQHAHARAFPRYMATQVFCALLSGLVSQVCASVFGAPPSVISVSSVVVGSGASFLLGRFWVFSDRGAA